MFTWKTSAGFADRNELGDRSFASGRPLLKLTQNELVRLRRAYCPLVSAWRIRRRGNGCLHRLAGRSISAPDKDFAALRESRFGGDRPEHGGENVFVV